jgi:hypothetical protein
MNSVVQEGKDLAHEPHTGAVFSDEPVEGLELMQISIEISGEIQQEAATRGIPIFTFVEELVERGLDSMRNSNSVSNAVERIRALRRVDSLPGSHGQGRLG